MPHLNILQNIFYSATKGEFVAIVRSSPCLSYIIPKVKKLLRCMQVQGSKGNKTNNSLKTINFAHPQNFQYFPISYENIIDLSSSDCKKFITEFA